MKSTLLSSVLVGAVFLANSSLVLGETVTLGGTAQLVPVAGDPNGNGLAWQITSGPGTGGAIEITPDSPIAVTDLTHLSAVFNMTEGDFGGGSPRFGLLVNDPDKGAPKYAAVYLGTPPNYTDLQSPGWQDSGNLANPLSPDLRVDLQQFGGGFYNTWAQAQAFFGANGVIEEFLFVLDGGWKGDQAILVDSITINGQQIAAVPEPTSLAIFGLATLAGGVYLRRRKNRADA